MVCVHAGPCPPDCHHPSDPWLSHSLCFMYKVWCQEGKHSSGDESEEDIAQTQTEGGFGGGSGWCSVTLQPATLP